MTSCRLCESTVSYHLSIKDTHFMRKIASPACLGKVSLLRSPSAVEARQVRDDVQSFKLLNFLLLRHPLKPQGT